MKILSLISAFLFPFFGTAQTLRPSDFEKPTRFAGREIVKLSPDSPNTFLTKINAANKSVNLYTPPIKLAFFCKMEDHFRNKHNIYLKLRVGNDEEYRKLIDRN